ncbi:MAG: hypothetical protein LBD44_05120 [Spirochaetaceae bacterium]|jgi:uncharacterized membrane protein YcgQ (UPF0703/DUF1980 family)|nr:hypothetical protein [Spirochaetaceae bacterium]
MNKNVFLLFTILFIATIPACKHRTPQAESAETKKQKAVELPTLEIKEKLFIAQTNDVYLNPDEYMGRRVSLEGLFKTDSYVGSEQTFRFVLRYGPGCCGYDGTAGFEVSWPQGQEAEYPVDDDWVEAVGVLDSYEEDGYPYIYLSLESLEIKEERGAETVLH